MKKILSKILSLAMLSTMIAVTPVAHAYETYMATDTLPGWKLEYHWYEQYNQYGKQRMYRTNDNVNTVDSRIKLKEGKWGLQLYYAHQNWTDYTFMDAKTVIPASKLEPNSTYEFKYWLCRRLCGQYAVLVNDDVKDSVDTNTWNDMFTAKEGAYNTVEVTTGETVSDITLTFRMYRGHAEYGGYMWIDDISFCKVGDDTNLVTNGGFEDSFISDFEAVSNGTNAVLTWNENADVTTAIISQLQEDGSWTELGTVDGGTKTYTVENLADEATYTFGITSASYSEYDSLKLVGAAEDMQTASVEISSTTYKEEVPGWEIIYKGTGTEAEAPYMTSSAKITSDSENIRNGKGAFELTKEIFTDGYTGIRTTIPADKLTANTDYTLSYYSKGMVGTKYDVAVSGAGEVAIIKALSEDTAYGDAETVTFKTGEDVSEGVTVEFKINEPSNLTSALWLDDITLAAADGVNLLENGDFENINYITDLKATPACSSAVLTWTENAAPSKVYFYKKVNGEWAEQGSVEGGVGTYTITGLANASTNELAVKYDVVSVFNPETVLLSSDYLTITSLWNYPTKELDGWTIKYYYQNQSCGDKMSAGLTGVNSLSSWNGVPAYNAETGERAIQLYYSYPDWTANTYIQALKSVPVANLKPNTKYKLSYWEGNTWARQYQVEVVCGETVIDQTISRGTTNGTYSVSYEFTTGESISGNLQIYFRLLSGHNEWGVGRLFLDDIAIYELDADGNTVGRNLVANGDFEDDVIAVLNKADGGAFGSIGNGSYILSSYDVYSKADYTTVIAVYDAETNALVKTFVNPVTYEADKTTSENISIGGLDEEKSYYAKVMVWDSMGNMAPVADVYQIN